MGHGEPVLSHRTPAEIHREPVPTVTAQPCLVAAIELRVTVNPWDVTLSPRGGENTNLRSGTAANAVRHGCAVDACTDNSGMFCFELVFRRPVPKTLVALQDVDDSHPPVARFLGFWEQCETEDVMEGQHGISMDSTVALNKPGPITDSAFGSNLLHSRRCHAGHPADQTWVIPPSIRSSAPAT